MEKYDGKIPEPGQMNAAYECAISYQRRFDSIADLHRIKSSAEVVKALRASWPDIEYRERFVVVMLDVDCHIIGYYTLGVGSMTSVVADVRIVAQHALLAKAVSVILAHNHPSGAVKPSQQDLNITSKIKSALELFDMKVLDHVVISAETYFSFADEGLI